jgi:hypothetical protein
LSTTLTIAAGRTFEVINSTTVRYDDGINGLLLYHNVTAITIGGETKTPAQIIAEAGGEVYSEHELRRVAKVEFIDPDQNGRQIATIYSTNSRHVGKNSVASIPGGAWVEMFNFLGTPETNYVLKMFDDFFTGPGLGLGSWHEATSPEWLGFKINYANAFVHAYVLTQVNWFGEESQPCQPGALGVPFMSDVVLTGKFRRLSPVVDNQGQAHYYVPIKSFRLYRSNTTEAGTAIFQRVPVEPSGYQLLPPNTGITINGPFPEVLELSFPNDTFPYGFTFLDNVDADKLLEALPSTDWSPPPPRGMQGLTAFRNGMMVAFSGNTLMFSEPFRPFAWPTKYYRSVPSNILAIDVEQNSLLVITDAEPYVIVGNHPAALSDERLENTQAGLPADKLGSYTPPSRAITQTPAGTVYGSAEGPIVIRGGTAQLLGRALFTRKEWQERYQQGFGKMRLAYSDGHLLAYFHNATLPGFRLALAEAALVKYEPPVTPLFHFNRPSDDSLYLGTLTQEGGGQQGTQIGRFADEDATALQFRYWTRELHLPKPENLGAIEIRGSGDEVGYVDVEVYTDGRPSGTRVPVMTFRAQFPTPELISVTMNLPAHDKPRHYSVLLRGTVAIVQEVLLASTRKELERA